MPTPAGMVSLPTEGGEGEVTFSGGAPASSLLPGAVPGQCVTYRRGPFAGEEHRFVGEFAGHLWVLRPGCDGVTCIAGDVRELAEAHGAAAAAEGTPPPADFLQRAAVALRGAPRQQMQWIPLDPLAPPLLADPSPRLAEYWCSGLRPGEFHEMDAGPWRGLVLRLRGLRSGAALFDVIGWDTRRLGPRAGCCASVAAPQAPLLLSVRLGPPQQQGQQGPVWGEGGGGSAFRSVAAGTQLRTLPTAEQRAAESAESGGAAADWLWRSVAAAPSERGPLAAETSAAAAQRLWVVNAHRRQWR
eukprot:TRINITY_DN11156_c0_g1_i1.p1 TRINITY_DN11156_c0_g1~~TRINITY_DN11156_c0_g1_i1.p1  ORF type:complete len:325 (+),score=89.83 TRINITY_DN11156_c0_g1_i1:75-977(+)